MMVIKKRHVELDSPNESENVRVLARDLQYLLTDLQISSEIDEHSSSGNTRLLAKDLQLQKDLQIDTLSSEIDTLSSEIDEHSLSSETDEHSLSSETDEHSLEILKDIKVRLGKMRIQDIAYDLNINVSTVKKYRKEILNNIGATQKEIILFQEQKIEKLRKAILNGEIERRPHNYSFGVEGLIRGIVKDLTIQGKSIKEIVDQTHLETSTISYHRKKIKNEESRKYPPRIMNMRPNKKIKVEKLLKENKKQKDICNILDISSATASVIVNKIKSSKTTKG